MGRIDGDSSGRHHTPRHRPEFIRRFRAADQRPGRRAHRPAHVVFPHEPFNALVRKGTAGATLAKILEASKPEAVYFTEQDGHRGAVLVVDVKDPSQIPAFAEPWFLQFQADCRFRIMMMPDELKRSGLDELAKKWG